MYNNINHINRKRMYKNSDKKHVKCDIPLMVVLINNSGTDGVVGERV